MRPAGAVGSRKPAGQRRLGRKEGSQTEAEGQQIRAGGEPGRALGADFKVKFITCSPPFPLRSLQVYEEAGALLESPGSRWGKRPKRSLPSLDGASGGKGRSGGQILSPSRFLFGGDFCPLPCRTLSPFTGRAFMPSDSSGSCARRSSKRSLVSPSHLARGGVCVSPSCAPPF